MTQTIKTPIAAVTGLLTMMVTTGALAQETKKIRSTFVEADYVYSSLELQSPAVPDWYGSSWSQGIGLSLKGSVDLFEQLLLRGSYYIGEGGGRKDVDSEVTSGVVSVGWLIPTPDDDAVAIDISLDYRTDNVELKGADLAQGKFDEDISGPGVSFGVRSAPTENTEFGVRVGWYQGDFDGAAAVNLNFGYNIGDQWGVNVYWDWIDADTSTARMPEYELSQFGVGGRFYF
jgi:hypothetical protein